MFYPLESDILEDDRFKYRMFSYPFMEFIRYQIKIKKWKYKRFRCSFIIYASVLKANRNGRLLSHSAQYSEVVRKKDD